MMRSIRLKAKGARPSYPEQVLEISVNLGKITVVDVETGETQLIRPVYGYEQHLWDYIQDLMK